MLSWSISRANSYLIICALSHWVTPVLPFCAPQVAPISPNSFQPHPMGLPHCIPGHGHNLSQNWSGAPPYWRWQGHHALSHGHHVTNAQPCTWQATSSAGLGLGGSNPHFIPSVSYYRLMLLWLLHSCCTHAFYCSWPGYWQYAPLCPVCGSILILLMWTATLVTDTFWPHVPIDYMSNQPCGIVPWLLFISSVLVS